MQAGRTATCAGLWLMVCLAGAAGGCGYIDKRTGVADAKALQAAGTPAQATVVRISDSGWTINNDPVADLLLEIRRGDGSTYQARTRSPIGRLETSRFQPGAVVPVRIDPKNPEHVALDVYTFKD